MEILQIGMVVLLQNCLINAVDFNKNQFINNIALGLSGGGHGGAIYSGGNGSLYFTNCNFTQNTALNGGAIHCNNSHSTDVVNLFLVKLPVC